MSNQIESELERLLALGNQLAEHLSKVSTLESDRRTYVRNHERWEIGVTAVLGFAGLDSFLQSFQSWSSYDEEKRVLSQLGVLESALDYVRAGFTTTLRHQIHATFFGRTIDEAEALLELGLLIPAAVLGRIVVEGWIRDQAEIAGLPTFATSKASVLNDGLRECGVFAKPRWRQIQVYLDIGNAAAHGKIPEAEDVVRLLSFGRAISDQSPA